MSEKKKSLYRRYRDAVSPHWSRNSLDNIAGMGGVASKGYLLRSAVDSFKKSIARRDRISETFEEAVQRKGITKEQLAENHRQLVLSSRVSYFFAVFLTLLCILNSTDSNVVYMAMFAIPCFIYSTFSGMLYSYRAYQIKNRKFLSFAEWIQFREEWFV